ncbi:MAG: SufD family Fe-S cluster assembly protein [Calditrichaeota bacterium]|nr:SufD family Fe-S cluster assembly protein [Calditrichota bacterium]
MVESTTLLDWGTLLRRSEEQLEPAWLRSLRRKALALFEKQTWPQRTDENWRFTDYRRLLPESLGGEPVTVEAPAVPSVDLEPALQGGISIRLGSPPVELAGAVQYMPLLEAVRAHESSLKRLLEEAEAHAVDRFDALALATFEAGFFVQVREGSYLDGPVALQLEPRPTENGWQSTFSSVSLGARSKGTLVIDVRPSEAGLRTFGSDHLRVEVGDGAEWNVLFLQRFGASDSRLQRVRFEIGNNARLQAFRLDLGGAVVKTEVGLAFKGENSEFSWHGAYLLGGNQRFELDTLQDHVLGGDTSNLLVKGVLAQQGRAVYRGLIRIHPGAQRSNAYQANKNLLLSEDAHVHSIPMLEIEANDVRCSHGSASGPIDPDQIFYLQSRGLPEREARRMIIKGFVAELLDEGVPPGFRDVLEGALEARVDQLLRN